MPDYNKNDYDETLLTLLSIDGQIKDIITRQPLMVDAVLSDNRITISPELKQCLSDILE